MANVFRATHFLALFFVLILLAGTEVSTASAKLPKLCSRKSKTWFGVCLISSHCNRQCRTWEKADHGGCHWDKRGFACFCYYKCKQPTP